MSALIAEFIGTFALTFIGAGAIMNLGGAGVLALVGIALAHGLTIAAMGSALGHISGGHFNPAVTFGFLITGKMKIQDGVFYMLSQVLGSIAAAALLKTVFPIVAVTATKLGTPLLAPNIEIIPGLIVEAVLTFFLVLVVFGTAVDSRAPKVGALFIGLTVALDILMGGPLTGAAMNPARQFGPALVGGYLENWWLYWIAPMLGGGAAALVYTTFFRKID